MRVLSRACSPYDPACNCCHVPCPAGSLYDFFLDVCYSCPAGWLWNYPACSAAVVATRACCINPANTTLCKDYQILIIPPPGTELVNTQGICFDACPSDQLWDFGYCLRHSTVPRIQATGAACCHPLCPLGYDYDPTLGSCRIRCASGLVYDPPSQTCHLPCRGGDIFDAGICHPPGVPCTLGDIYDAACNCCHKPCGAGQAYDRNGVCFCYPTTCPGGLTEHYDFNLCKCVPSCGKNEIFIDGKCTFVNPLVLTTTLPAPTPTPSATPSPHAAPSPSQSCPSGEIFDASCSCCHPGSPCTNSNRIYDPTCKACHSRCSNVQVFDASLCRCRTGCNASDVYSSGCNCCHAPCTNGKVWNDQQRRCI